MRVYINVYMSIPHIKFCTQSRVHEKIAAEKSHTSAGRLRAQLRLMASARCDLHCFLEASCSSPDSNQMHCKRKNVNESVCRL